MDPADGESPPRSTVTATSPSSRRRGRAEPMSSSSPSSTRRRPPARAPPDEVGGRAAPARERRRLDHRASIGLRGDVDRDARPSRRKAGKGPQVFGDGDNPINFVSVEDVAVAVARAATDATLRGQVIEVGGPDDLTLNELARDGPSERGSTSPAASRVARHGSGRSARATVVGAPGPDEPGHGPRRPALRRVSRPCGIPVAAVQLGARPRARGNPLSEPRGASGGVAARASSSARRTPRG